MIGVNYFGIIVGGPGCGKTTLARSLISAHVDEVPTGIVIAHDPVRQFVADGACWYDNAAAWRVAMAAAAAAGKEVPRVSSLGGDAKDVTRLALEIGRASCRERVLQVV